MSSPLSSTLRHDMANILTPAIIRAELLAEHPDPDIKQHALMILASLEKLTALIKKER